MAQTGNQELKRLFDNKSQFGKYEFWDQIERASADPDSIHPDDRFYIDVWQENLEPKHYFKAKVGDFEYVVKEIKDKPGHYIIFQNMISKKKNGSDDIVRDSNHYRRTNATAETRQYFQSDEFKQQQKQKADDIKEAQRERREQHREAMIVQRNLTKVMMYDIATRTGRGVGDVAAELDAELELEHYKNETSS